MPLIENLVRTVERVMEANGMTATPEPDPWMSTGEAARALGYRSTEGFVRKFIHVITVMRTKIPNSRWPGGGHYRWSREEVMRLRDQSIIF